MSGVKTTTGISVSSNTAAISKPEIVKIGGKTAVISQPLMQTQQQQTGNTTASKIVQAQLQPITAQQLEQRLVNAKVLQGFSQGISPLQQRVKAGTTSIRMVNASNLNIANIDGKQIIIAKTPTMIQSPNQSATGNKTIWTQQGSGGAVAKVIGTLPGAQPSQVLFGNQFVKLQPQQLSTGATVSTSTATILNLNANSVLAKNSIATTPSVSNASIVSSVGTKAVLLSSTGQTIKVGHASNVIATTNAAGFKPMTKVKKRRKKV